MTLSQETVNSPRWWLSSRVWLAVLIGYWVSLFVGTHWPSNARILTGGFLDKAIHFSAFGLLALLMAIVVQLRGIELTMRTLVLIWTAIAVYGVADELLQPLVGRSCEFYDWLADVMGTAFALWVYSKLFSERVAQAC